MSEHIIIIKENQFLPATLRIQSGDTVVWENQDDTPHTATSGSLRPPFDTGIIEPDTRSRSIVFPSSAAYGGVEVYCRCHPSMDGRIFVTSTTLSAPTLSAEVIANTDTPADETTSTPGVTYSLNVWRTISRIVAAYWIYDMADNFAYAKGLYRDPALATINSEWEAIETYWKGLTGTTESIIDSTTINPQAFLDQSRENLEALGRRIRGLRRRLRSSVIIPQYPFPARPDDPDENNPYGRLYGGQSDDPFGEAITVNYAGLRLSPFQNTDGTTVLRTEVQQAEIRQENYALGPLWTIESKTDAGEPVTDQDKQSYQQARAALQFDDYHVLAAHLYYGLSKLFNSGEFQEDKFTAGIHRMTARGEWDGSWQPMWHWLRWIDGYITVKETGKLPNPLGI